MPYTPWAARSRDARSSRSPCANSTPWLARFRAVSLLELRVSARKFHPLASIWRITAPPCCPVAPVMSTVLSVLSMILSLVSRDSVHIFCGEQEPKSCSSLWVQSTWLEGVAHREHSLLLPLTCV